MRTTLSKSIFVGSFQDLAPAVQVAAVSFASIEPRTLAFPILNTTNSTITRTAKNQNNQHGPNPGIPTSEFMKSSTNVPLGRTNMWDQTWDRAQDQRGTGSRDKTWKKANQRELRKERPLLWLKKMLVTITRR